MAVGEKIPAFQYYPKDLLSDAKVLAMTLEEFGAYWKLVSICWLERTIPDDIPSLAKMLHISAKRMARLWPAITLCFEPTSTGRLLHPRLEKEWRRQAAWREKCAKGGQRSVEARAFKGSCNLVGATEQGMGHSSSSSSSATSPVFAEELSPTTQSMPKKEKPSKPCYECACFAVWPWMEVLFIKRLEIADRTDFVLFDWYETVRTDLEKQRRSLPPGDSFRYLMERLYADADLPKPSLAQARRATDGAPSLLSQLLAAAVSDEAKWTLKHVCRVEERDGVVSLSAPVKYVLGLEAELARFERAVGPVTVRREDG